MHAVFLPISVPGALLISNLEGSPLIEEWHLKEGGACFKV